MYFVVAQTIATAIVSSRLDYCNSLYNNIALKDILKVHRVQNCLARVITRSPRVSLSLPLLKSLHCLLARCRIINKIRTYQVVSSNQPACIHSLFTRARQPRQLRSSNYNLLCFPNVKKNVGTRASSVVPSPRDSLPVSVLSVGHSNSSQ